MKKIYKKIKKMFTRNVKIKIFATIIFLALLYYGIFIQTGGIYMNTSGVITNADLINIKPNDLAMALIVWMGIVFFLDNKK